MSLSELLTHFVPRLQKKSAQVARASWLLETTGSADAASLKADLDLELSLLFHDQKIFDQLLVFEKEGSIQDPLVKRQLFVLLRAFKLNRIEPSLLEQISKTESELSLVDAHFRPVLNGKTLSDSDIRTFLKEKIDLKDREEVWQAAKQVGKERAPYILKLVKLRNEAARSLGYADYFTMQLTLQEVDEKWLFDTFTELLEKTEEAYREVCNEILEHAKLKYDFKGKELTPYLWAEPFAQEDPLDVSEIDRLVAGSDIVSVCAKFYEKMGLDCQDILERSDQLEREGKNPHAFCTHIDRAGDIRVLNNVKPTIKWLETMLHELGHAVYEKGFDQSLPWLLKEPPHMITTEAIALLAGRQAYRISSLDQLVGKGHEALKQKAEKSLTRRQLIFSRFATLMTFFERELYRNPDQDLQALWWKMCGSIQKIHTSGSTSGADWAAKYHIGLAPVYYFSYLLGELFASSLEEKITDFASLKTGQFLKEAIFIKGNTLSWKQLIESALGEPFTQIAWIRQYASR